MALLARAYAKINLLLDLTGVYPNGYHGIYTVMQSIDAADELIMEKKASGVSLRCADGAVPTDDRNTAVRAASLFFEKTGLSGGVDIVLNKNIPTQAGMGGGSADAAVVIEGLDRLYGTALSPAEKSRMGVRVGADVPFCLVGGTALCLHIGELIAPLPPLPDCRIVYVKPAVGSSTANAYAGFDALKDVRRPAAEQAVHAYMQGELGRFYELSANVFEQAVEVPDRAMIKAVMRSFRCDLTLMTGSGSVVFGIFSEPERARACADALIRGGQDAHLARPVRQGVELVPSEI